MNFGVDGLLDVHIKRDVLGRTSLLFGNSRCCGLWRRVWGSGTLVAVDSILLLEWYYKKQKQFIINVIEYWKLSESYPSSNFAVRFRYVLVCSGGYNALWPLRVHTL